jgi:hypothetical protein
VTLREYRNLFFSSYVSRWQEHMSHLLDVLPRMPVHPRTLRGMSMFQWYSAVLVEGPSVLTEPYSLLESIFEDQCRRPPKTITTAELTLAGHANLFACAGWADYTEYFRPRLMGIKTDRNGNFAEWHFARALAGKEKPVYRGPVAADIGLDEIMPFTPYQRHGYNPQSLLAHLAGAVENRASIEEVWPAFKELMFHFPGSEQAGVFDGSCLFWIARIVHHELGGQPLGETAAWLHRHFNAWADGKDLPPLEGR